MLVVEDDDTVRALFSRLLSGLGCIVVGARDGAQARGFAAGAEWDVVLVDLGLPDVDGLVLLPELVELQRDFAPAFIVLTGRYVAEDQVPSGCTILTKPIRIHALTAAAKAGIDAARARRKRVGDRPTRA